MSENRTTTDAPTEQRPATRRGNQGIDPVGAKSVDDDVLAYLRDRVDDGNSYVRVNHVTDAISEEFRLVGRRLSALEDAGVLERWSDADRSPTYRIDRDELEGIL